MIRKINGLYLIADIAKALGTDNSNVAGIAYEYDSVTKIEVDGVHGRIATDEKTLRKILNRDWKTRNSKAMKEACRQISLSLFGEDVESFSKERQRLLEEEARLLKDLEIVRKKIQRVELDIEISTM